MARPFRWRARSFQGNGKTFLCYFPDDKNDLPLEHLELSYTDWKHLVASCRKCNKVRGNTAFADWLRHPRYLATSPQLSQAVRDQNAALAAVVHQIPRASSQRSR